MNMMTAAIYVAALVGTLIVNAAYAGTKLDPCTYSDCGAAASLVTAIPAARLVEPVPGTRAVDAAPQATTSPTLAAAVRGPLLVAPRLDIPTPRRTDAVMAHATTPMTGLNAGSTSAGARIEVAQARPTAEQATPRGQTVLTRPRPELDPLGARLGAFRFFPQVTVREQYNDNVFANNSGIDDLITRILPAARLQSDWSRHALSLYANGDIGIHLDRGDEDFQDYEVGSNGELEVTRNTIVSAGASYRNAHEQRFSPDDVGGSEPTEIDILAANLDMRQTLGRFRVQVTGNAQQHDYDDAVAIVGGARTLINNDDRDRTEYAGSGRLGYEIVPGYEAFVRGTYSIRDYDDQFDDGGINRDSDGVSGVAGIRIDFGGITFGDFFVGYQQRSYDDRRLADNSGFTAGADLTWNPTALTTVVGTLTNTIEETTVTGSSGTLSTAGAIRVDHELLRNLLLGGKVSLDRVDFRGVGRTDNTLGAGVSARYMVNRNINISASYQYRNRFSDVDTVEFDQNVLSVSLVLRY